MKDSVNGLRPLPELKSSSGVPQNTYKRKKSKFGNSSNQNLKDKEKDEGNRNLKSPDSRLMVNNKDPSQNVSDDISGGGKKRTIRKGKSK